MANYSDSPYPGSAGPWRMTPTTVDGVPPLSSFFGSLGFSPAPRRVITRMYDHRPAWSSIANFGNLRVDCITGLSNVEWYETAPELVFKTDIAGLSKEDIQVQVADEEYPYGRMLTICWRYKGEKVPPETDKRYLLECNDEQIVRMINLPRNANLDAVTASVAGGVLTVVVPMLHKKAHGPRTIEISGWEEPAELVEAAPTFEIAPTVEIDTLS